MSVICQFCYFEDNWRKFVSSRENYGTIFTIKWSSVVITFMMMITQRNILASCIAQECTAREEGLSQEGFISQSKLGTMTLRHPLSGQPLKHSKQPVYSLSLWPSALFAVWGMNKHSFFAPNGPLTKVHHASITPTVEPSLRHILPPRRITGWCRSMHPKITLWCASCCR